MGQDLPNLHLLVEEDYDLDDFIGRKVSARIELKGSELLVEKATAALDLSGADIEDPILARILFRKDQAPLAQAASESLRHLHHDKHLGDYDVPARVIGTLRRDEQGYHLTNAAFDPEGDLRIAAHSTHEISLYKLDFWHENPGPTTDITWELEGIDHRTGRQVFLQIFNDQNKESFLPLVNAMPDGKPMKLTVTGSAVFDARGKMTLAVRDSQLAPGCLAVDDKPLDPPVETLDLMVHDFRHANYAAKSKELANGSRITAMNGNYLRFLAIGPEKGAQLESLLGKAQKAIAAQDAKSTDVLARITGRAREVTHGTGFRKIVQVTEIQDLTTQRAAPAMAKPRSRSAGLGL